MTEASPRDRPLPNASSGQVGTAAQLGLKQDTILIARNLGPAELLEYDRRRLKGVILDADGSIIYDLFDEFGITPTTINFDLRTAN